MTPKQLLDLDKIISEKEWINNPLHESVKNKLFKLLNKLENDEVAFILELLGYFTWITNSQYDKKILDIFRKIDPKIIKSAKKFYFFPIVKPRDANKLKSGVSLIYPIVGILNYLEDLEHINKGNNNIIMDYKSLRKINLKTNEYLILVDDFIGSGKTFDECFRKLEEYNVDKDKILVCSLAIQGDGLKLIEDKGVKVYYSHVEKKGITENYKKEEASEKISKMLLIEKKLKYNEKYSLGFEKSEGLISMIKTPNNTFPFFWHDYIENEELIKAPFPRY